MLIDQVAGARAALTGQVAVVTGAGRGIGREAARALARLGAAVVVAELDPETGEATAALIRREGGEARFVQVDVADEGSVTALRDGVNAGYGRADIRINNAVTFTFGPLWEQSVAQWDRVMAVNLRGAFLCIRAFLPAMLARRRGVVVTMESSEGMAYLAPYLASKVGLRSLALSLAREVGEESGVSVFCFGPGMVDTPGIGEALAELPGLYGMSREEFIRESGVHLLPAELSATGLAGAVLYAREFHGQQVGHASGLVRLGLGADGAPLAVRDPGPGSGEEAPLDGDASLLALNRQLEAVLEANVREYSELTMFQRPIVRLMFQQATGLKVEEWLEQARSVSRRLERGGGVPEREAYVASLRRLAGFIRKQESDARGYFRDPVALERALRALGERYRAVSRLADELEAGG